MFVLRRRLKSFVSSLGRSFLIPCWETTLWRSTIPLLLTANWLFPVELPLWPPLLKDLGIERARPALVRLAQPAVQRFGKSPLRTLLRCEVQRHDERRDAAIQGATARVATSNRCARSVTCAGIPAALYHLLRQTAAVRRDERSGAVVHGSTRVSELTTFRRVLNVCAPAFVPQLRFLADP